MASAQWYYRYNESRVGPVSTEEMRRRVAAGHCTGATLVWREGMPDWTPAADVPGLLAAASDDQETPSAPIEAAPPEVRAAPPRRQRLDGLLESIRASLPEGFTEATSLQCAACGRWTLVAAAAPATLGLGFWMSLASGALDPLLVALGGSLALVVLGYAAGRIVPALARLGHSTSEALVSTALLDSLALASMVAGFAVLVSVTIVASESGRYAMLGTGLAAFVVLEHVTFVALDLRALGIQPAAGLRPAEEALATLAVLGKLALGTVPVVFGVGVLWSTCWLAGACYWMNQGPEGHATAAAVAREAGAWLLGFAAIPVVAYLLYLLWSIVLAALSGWVARGIRTHEP